MGPTERITKELANRGHPLAQNITSEEVPLLIDGFRKKLGVSGDELNLFPKSLKTLEQILMSLHKAQLEKGENFTNEEVAELVRGIAAYIGEILIRHAGARWSDTSRTLWGTEVTIDGPWQVIKDRKYTSPYPTHFILGSDAAWALDEISAGRKPNLFRTYSEARTKSLRERLL